MSQLAFADGYKFVSCKARGCTQPVVGSSVTGEGHVCRLHNEREWGHALARQTNEPWLRDVGLDLLAHCGGS